MTALWKQNSTQNLLLGNRFRDFKIAHFQRRFSKRGFHLAASSHEIDCRRRGREKNRPDLEKLIRSSLALSRAARSRSIFPLNN